MTLRVRALSLTAAHLGLELRGALRAGLEHVGVHGGDHVVRDARGRLFGVDLVTRSVAMFVGVPPQVEPW